MKGPYATIQLDAVGGEVDVSGSICTKRLLEMLNLNKKAHGPTCEMKGEMSDNFMDGINEELFKESRAFLVTNSKNSTRFYRDSTGKSPGKRGSFQSKALVLRDLAAAKKYAAIFVPYLKPEHWVFFVVFPNHGLVVGVDSMGFASDVVAFSERIHPEAAYETMHHHMLKQSDDTSCGYMAMVNILIFARKVEELEDDIRAASREELQQLIKREIKINDLLGSETPFEYTRRILRRILRSIHESVEAKRGSGVSDSSRIDDRVTGGSSHHVPIGSAKSDPDMLDLDDRLERMFSSDQLTIIGPERGRAKLMAPAENLTGAVMRAFQLWALVRGLPIVFSLKGEKKHLGSRGRDDVATAVALLEAISEIEGRIVSCLLFKSSNGGGGGELDYAVINPAPERGRHPETVYVVVHVSSDEKAWRPVFFEDRRVRGLCPVLDTFDLSFHRKLSEDQTRALVVDRVKAGTQNVRFDPRDGPTAKLAGMLESLASQEA
jgi:hypothetical protein